MRRGILSSVNFLVVAGVVGAACGAAGGRPASAPVEGRAGVPMAPLASPAPGQGTDVVGASLPQLQQRVVKSASISVQLKKGTFAQQFQEASLIAGRHGGYVGSSETTEGKLQ